MCWFTSQDFNLNITWFFRTQRNAWTKWFLVKITLIIQLGIIQLIKEMKKGLKQMKKKLKSVWVNNDSAFLILSPPAKRHHHDVTMHAVHFGGQGRSYLSDQRVPPTCDWKRGEGRKETEHWPLDEIWTCKPYFILPICKRRVQCTEKQSHITQYLSNKNVEHK